jgi:hypothetical protein
VNTRLLLAVVAIASPLAACSSPAVGTAPSPASPLAVRASSTTNCPAASDNSGVPADGDFSKASEPGSNGDVVYFKGQIFAPGWKVTTDSIDFVGSAYWDVGGYCSVDLDGQQDHNPVGGIKSASFETQPNQKYNVIFTMSGNGHCPPTVKTMDVEAAGQFAQFTWDTSNNNDAQHGQYAQQSWQFTATKSFTRLTLKSQDPKKSGCGAVVADIYVVPA